MQTALVPYNPVRVRNIAAEMAEIAREKGEGVTREDLQKAGYTKEQIEKHAHDASVLYAQGSRLSA